MESNLINADPQSVLPFWLYEPIRDYATEELERRGRSAATREQHARYFLQLSELGEIGLLSPEQARWFDRLRANHSNIRIALDWFKETGDLASLRRMVGSLWWFWKIDGSQREGLELCRVVGQRGGGVVEIADARVAHTEGLLALVEGEFERAEVSLEAALRAFERGRDEAGGARTLNWLGLLGLVRADPSTAKQHFVHSAELARRCGEAMVELWATANLSGVLAMEDDLGAALAADTEARETATRIGDRQSEALGLTRAHWIAFLAEDTQKAESLRGHALAAARSYQDPNLLLLTLSSVAIAEAVGGRRDRSGPLLREAARLADIAAPFEVATWLEAAAWHLLNGDESSRAAEIMGAVAALETRIDAPYPAAARLRAKARDQARAQLGADRFNTEFDKGLREPTEEVVARAVGWLMEDDEPRSVRPR